MSLLIDSHEVENHYTEYGFINTQTNAVTWCPTQQEAEFDALLYPFTAIVQREVYETKPVVILTSS
jgi:hypothetical protein